MVEFLDTVSAPLASKMLQQMGLDKTTEPFKLLDNGAGLGVVAAEIQKMVNKQVLAKSSIISADFSESTVEFVRRRIEKEGWVNTDARVVDAQKTGFPDNEFTHLTMNIGFHVVPDSEAALRESIRVLKPGGTLGFTTWHDHGSGWEPDFRSALASFPFEAPFVMRMQTTRWGNWSNVNWIRRTLEDLGLEDVKVDVMARLQHIHSPDDFVACFEMMFGWVINSNWSEELRREHGLEEVKSLIREHLEAKYGGRDWDVTWTSIIASARVPGGKYVEAV
ncbi:S-adenosyl-L-methionine-dependent methyltransferase [Coniochaeta ligniaria NRRL 30616]|uniref:S-adenosyl-L-methionine-dependent methyltransferase n=1 Tax=Coniochaeta ligniaria NRRL 30616 TaxID=1408157 RepID=A0A1J7J652_9PEZI|nr:S-adenosyl-L-methionine-dependent methyltransferase [Coniochaeta ligniaria NRRL 30616]